MLQRLDQLTYRLYLHLHLLVLLLQQTKPDSIMFVMQLQLKQLYINWVAVQQTLISPGQGHYQIRLLLPGLHLQAQGQLNSLFLEHQRLLLHKPQYLNIK